MKLKIGFIGTGGIAAHHLKNLAKMDDVDVVGFADLQPERASQAAAEWSNAKAYSDAKDMLDDLKLDGVYICVPPMAHGNAEKQVIERGLPFLVEKPLGIEYGLAAEIASLVAGKGLITSVGFHWRYSETVQQAREIVRNDTPGMALGYWMGGMPTTPWWRQQNASGGQFVEQTIHIADLLRYLCGEVTEVYSAFSQRGNYEGMGVTVPDVGTVTMKLENGMVATLSNTCMLPISGRVGLDIYSGSGILEVDTDILKQHREGHVDSFRSRNNAFHSEDAVFLNAVRTGDPTGILSDYADALKTHRVAMAANESAFSGKAVRLIP